jgi:similar to stage IV sporulation protein
MLLSFDNLAWVSLNKQGCVLEVNMTEFESKKHVSSPQNIVAECDGVIRRIDASKGSVNVKIGDTVVKNQVLVSGILSYGYENNFVEPQAEILAEIKYFKKINVDKLQKSIVYNGKEKNRYSIEIMGLKIPLFFKDEQNLHKTEKSERKLIIFGGEIPIKIYKDKSLYYNEFTYEIDREKAEKTANEMLEKHFKEINAECKDIDLIDIKETNGGFTFEYYITCIKDIGVKKIIEFS